LKKFIPLRRFYFRSNNWENLPIAGLMRVALFFMSNLVAIVGRPNVGKSTLFNRLSKSRRAIVTDEAGTTRDRQYAKSEWNGQEFSIVDTGGWVVNSDDIFEEEIRRQVAIAIEEADIILFVVDVQNGITDLDMQVAQILRQSKKTVLLVSNKCDTFDLQYQSSEFYAFGLGEPHSISAVNGSGTGELLDELVSLMKQNNLSEGEEELELDIPRFAVVGRPNAGKSSIVNAFLDDERNIVTDIPGTTRDSIYTRYNKFGHDFYLVDTAGIRKKAKVNEDLEYYSVIRSIRAIENSDVCILMIDATRGIEAQDLNIFSLIQKNKKGLVVCINKWDLIETDAKDAKGIKAFENAIRTRLAPFVDFPIIFTSALTKQRIFKVIEMAAMVYENKKRRISTHKLNEFMGEVIDRYPPPALKGKFVKIKYVTQLPDTQVPTFVFFANLPQYVKEPYKRYLENKIREEWNFNGTPIQLFIRQK
jgi:GTP-binding protein